MKDDQAFVFDRKPQPHAQGYPFVRNEEEMDPFSYSKSVPDPEFAREPRQRANTMSEGSAPADQPADGQEQDGQKETLPTVFKWDGGGKQVYISGTFSDWKALPMVKSHGDFVTIINIPEGDHEYKFLVDGEWKHDPKLVSMTIQPSQQPCGALLIKRWFLRFAEKCRE